MNFNFSSFLNGSLRILNIANRTLPLIKEATPAIKNIKKKYQDFKRPNRQGNNGNNVKTPPFIEKKKAGNIQLSSPSNLPTFFK